PAAGADWPWPGRCRGGATPDAGARPPSVHHFKLRPEAARMVALVADAQDLVALHVRGAVDRADHRAITAADRVQAVARLAAAGFRRVEPGWLGAVHVQFVVVDHAADEVGRAAYRGRVGVR